MRRNTIKKITAIIFCIIIFTVNISAFAEELPPSVVDEADILLDSQESELKVILDSLRTKYNMDVSIVTTKDTDGKSAMAFADDYFDYNGYGCGENDDGIMLVVSMGTREYHFTTHQRGITVFNDNALIYFEDEVVPDLSAGNYYSAFMTYAECAEEILIMEANGEYFTCSPETRATGYAIALFIPLIIALIVTFVQYKNMNDAQSRAEADEYVEGNLKMDNVQDIFLYSTVHKTARPKDNGGGSSTHRSSSGRSHGGRGGSF